MSPNRDSTRLKRVDNASYGRPRKTNRGLITHSGPRLKTIAEIVGMRGNRHAVSAVGRITQAGVVLKGKRAVAAVKRTNKLESADMLSNRLSRAD